MSRFGLVVAMTILAWRQTKVEGRSPALVRHDRRVFMMAAVGLPIIGVQAFLGALIVWYQLAALLVATHAAVAAAFFGLLVLILHHASNPPMGPAQTDAVTERPEGEAVTETSDEDAVTGTSDGQAVTDAYGGEGG